MTKLIPTCKGLTLLELLISLSIVSLLLAISMPSYDHVKQRQKSDTTIASIYEMYQLGRNRAVRERKSVMFCGSNTVDTCEKSFSKYLLLFVDANNDQNPDDDELIHIRQLKIDNSVITTRAAFGKPYTILHQSGSASLTGSMIFCAESGTARYANRVTWNRAGRPYKGIDRDKNGFIDDRDGKDIEC